VPSLIELTTTAVATGGEAVARDADGRVVLVEGALPGERHRVELTGDRRGVARARSVAVLEGSPGRVDPPCPEFDRGCGGCGWQFATPDRQRDLKVDIVADCLQRLAGLDVPVTSAGPLPDLGYRTTVRLAVEGGRAGYRRRRSHDVHPVAACLVLHPALDALLAEARWADAREVVLRVGARTGERLVVVDPSAAGLVVPDGVRLVGRDELAAGKRAWIHEELAGRRWRLSAESFAQASPEGAEALGAAVVRAAGSVAPGAHVVDAYGGIGLLGGVVAGSVEGWTGRITVLEHHPAAAADARVNLADLDARVVRTDIERWTPRRADLVVADPSRAGLGTRGARSVVGTHAPTVVLVSCDPASLARDAGLLATAGYDLEGVEVVDLFPHTAHVEAVSRFTRR
jgi:23S rRNA (uracil1939-C5)-methyltransferase